MEQVDLQGSGNVVGAIAKGGVGTGADRVLHDPDVVAEDVQMPSADRMERPHVRH
jgi:hypothetical protein